MRIMVRVLGLSLGFILIFMIFAQMLIFNVKQDELINCVSTAISSTQIVMKEQIEDETYGTDNKRKSINSNEEYLQEFKTNLDMLKNDNSNFKINVYGIDYEKGLIDVEVESSFIMLNGQVKNIKTRKTSIVDMIKIGGANEGETTN